MLRLMRKPERTAALVLAAFLFFPVNPAGGAEEVRGIASIIDSDTIQVGETVIRLQGIDAPEGCPIIKGNISRNGMIYHAP